MTGALIAATAWAEILQRDNERAARVDGLVTDLAKGNRIIRYVHAVDGDDMNNGQSQAKPYQTLNRAIEDGPDGGLVEIRIGSNVSTTGRVHPNNANVIIRSYILYGPRRTFTLAVTDYSPPDPAFAEEFTHDIIFLNYRLGGAATCTYSTWRLPVHTAHGYPVPGRPDRGK